MYCVMWYLNHQKCKNMLNLSIYELCLNLQVNRSTPWSPTWTPWRVSLWIQTDCTSCLEVCFQSHTFFIKMFLNQVNLTEVSSNMKHIRYYDQSTACRGCSAAVGLWWNVVSVCVSRSRLLDPPVEHGEQNVHPGVHRSPEEVRGVDPRRGVPPYQVLHRQRRGRRPRQGLRMTFGRSAADCGGHVPMGDGGGVCVHAVMKQRTYNIRLRPPLWLGLAWVPKQTNL